jgi:hypothetical protein
LLHYFFFVSDIPASFSGNPFQLNLIIADKTAGTNTLAYLASSSATKKKIFYKIDTRWSRFPRKVQIGILAGSGIFLAIILIIIIVVASTGSDQNVPILLNFLSSHEHDRLSGLCESLEGSTSTPTGSCFASKY